MRLKLSLLTLSLFSLSANAATTVADTLTFNTVDQVAVNKSTQIENMANKISEKLQNFGQGQIQAQSTIAAYKEKQRISNKINDLTAELTQPTNNCEKLRNGAKSSTFSTMTRSESQLGSASTVKAAFITSNGATSEIKAYEDNVKRFCNMQQQANGQCHFSTSSELIDGDINVSLMFGSDGEDTRKSEQDTAMAATVQHLTGEDYLLPPYRIDTTTDASGMYSEDVVLDANELPSQAQRYENIRKRHSAVIGLVSEGLLSASNSHTYMPIDITNYNNTVIERDTDERYEDPLAGIRGSSNPNDTSNANNDSPFVISSSPIDPKSRPAMIAEYAYQKTAFISVRAANNAKIRAKYGPAGSPKGVNKSLGYCASYVADALIDGGKFNYSRPNSAYQAGPYLEKIGYKQIPLNTKPQVGDILVLAAHGVPPTNGKSCSETGCKHGHIQIYTGIKGGMWVSDFRQTSPNSLNLPHPAYFNAGKKLYRHSSVLNEAK